MGLNHFLRSALKGVLDCTLVPIVKHVWNRLPLVVSLQRPNVHTELDRFVARECAIFVHRQMQRALEFRSREEVWD